MLAARFLTLGLAGLSLAACSAGSGPRDVGGAGPGTGAPVSSAVGGSSGTPPASTSVSPAIGSFLGNRLSAGLDDDDKRRAYTAQIRALETGPSGAPVAWRNPDSGRYGNIVPGPVYPMNGEPCRQYTHTVFIDGRPQSKRGTACRNPEGIWAPVG